MMKKADLWQDGINALCARTYFKLHDVKRM
jgi:hypothetical protein